MVVPRLAVLWWPHWPVVAVAADPGEPVAVVHANRVVAHTAAAGAEGVRSGQRRREAQARCPSLRLEPYDPARDAHLFERVVQAVGERVPRLEIGEPGTLTFHARGPARYFGGESAMAAMVAEVASTALDHPVDAGTDAGTDTGTDARLAARTEIGIGIADGRFAATVAARRSARVGAPLVVPAGVGPTAEFLAPASVRWLATAAGVPDEVVHLMARMGLRRLGDLAALPVADLHARFGEVGAFVHRLATGGDDRLPGTVDPPSGLQVREVFEQPVHHSDAVVFTGRRLAEQLTSVLAAEGRVCTRLSVTAETEHGERSERRWYRSGGLSAAAMVERIRWQLDGWAQQETLTAGVTALTLAPVEVRADDGVQMGLWGGRTEADEWAVRAVARLVALAGESQVLVPAAAGGRQPHEAYTWVPAVTADLLDPADRLRARSGPWPGSLPQPSPALVHDPPLSASVLDADGHPVRVGSRSGVSAPPAIVTVDDPAGPWSRRIHAWAGPWPVEERWWDASRARRAARLQVLTDDGRLLLLIVQAGQWGVLADHA